jgi:hypothetical protein
VRTKAAECARLGGTERTLESLPERDSAVERAGGRRFELRRNGGELLDAPRCAASHAALKRPATFGASV